MKDDKQNDRQGVALSEDEWIALAAEYAAADWNCDQPDGYLNAVKALVTDALSRASSSQGVALSDEEIDRIAREHNLDGSMLGGPRNEYWRSFARAILSRALSSREQELMRKLDDTKQALHYWKARASSSREEVEIPEGYVLVPRIPTAKMLIAGEHYFGTSAWPRMLAAAEAPNGEGK